MKRRRSGILCLWVLSILLFNVAAFAQQTVVVSGTVLTEKGDVLQAVTVLATRRGDDSRKSLSAFTNDNGIFTFSQLKVGEVYDFAFSSVGYETQFQRGFTVKQTGKSNTLLIRLRSKSDNLNEVVVTALGIKKSERTLGYALTKVDSTQVTEAPGNNWLDALSGKVAGLHLVRSGSGPAASSKIILRGENNLSGNNEALIVIDGIVVSNGSSRRSANGSDLVYATNSDNLPADYGSALNDLNPQDIESISVLKGPAAAALYGQMAANGAVIITTKNARQTRKGHFNVRYTINGNMEQANRFPDMQYEYGQGLGGALYYSYGTTADGASTSGTSSAYGPKFDGQQFYQYDPVRQAVGRTRTTWQAYDNINEFWNTGTDLRNNLNLDGKIGKTQVRINLGTEKNSWIVPNTGFDRKSIALSTNTQITKNLKISTKVNYGYRNSDNLPAAGYGNQSLMYWYMFWQPSADHNWLKNYWAGGPGSTYDSLYKMIRYPFSSFPENPYAIVNEFLNKTRRNNVTGNVVVNYQVTNNLSLMLRTNLDWMNDKRAQLRPYDAGTRLPKGSYRTQNVYSQEKSYDFMAKYTTDINRDIKLGITAGGSQVWNHYYKKDIRNDGLRQPGIYTMENSLYGLTYWPDTARYRINSFYGIANLSYKNYWFTELTFRQDWNSTLANVKRQNSTGFSYPAINTSFILSEVAELPHAINYMKLRAALAGVGSAESTPYKTLYKYNYAGGGIYPDSAQIATNIIPNVNMRPLRTVTFELGTEVQLFQNRISMDVAVYFGSTDKQLLTRRVDAASGYSSAFINAGRVRNNGIEIQLNAKPIVAKKAGFEWSVMGTFSYNKNKIVSMPDSSILLRAGQIASGQIVASVGGSMGDLYGLGYQRSPDGQVIFDGTTGFPKITENIKYLGNTTPPYKFSLGNTFRYKGLSLNVLFDAQMGAVAYSLTHYKMVEQGKLRSTLPGRYNGIIGNGVTENSDKTFRKNDVVATDIDQYYQYSMGSYNAEGSTFSTDFIKFREAALNYAFKPKLLKNLGLTTASIGIYGRDLFIWSPWPIFDPEFGTLSGTDIVRGFEVGQFPSTRSMGFTLSVGF